MFIWILRCRFANSCELLRLTSIRHEMNYVTENVQVIRSFSCTETMRQLMSCNLELNLHRTDLNHVTNANLNAYTHRHDVSKLALKLTCCHSCVWHKTSSSHVFESINFMSNFHFPFCRKILREICRLDGFNGEGAISMAKHDQSTEFLGRRMHCATLIIG